MRRAKGFTLFELLIALAILAIAWTIAMPALTSVGGVGALDRDAERAAAALREARSMAIAQNRIVPVAFNLSQRSILIDGSGFAVFDSKTELSVTTAEQLASDDRGTIIFYPNGGATGGAIALSRDSARRTVTVDWLLGKTEVHRDR